jgi:hypothetical protein
MESLSRTFNPKHIHYATDGRGRDGYIHSNNGGLNMTSAKLAGFR